MESALYKTPPSHRLTVSSLLSPPEMKRSESFGSTIPPAFGPINAMPPKSKPVDDMVSYMTAVRANRHAYASPPISPSNSQSQKENMEIVEEQGIRDPQLFTSGSGANPVAHIPLFPQDSSDQVAQDVITEHMKSTEYANLENKPSREDYELAISFCSTVFESAVKNPRQWWAQERRFDSHYGKPTSVQKRLALKKLAPAPSSRSRAPKVAVPRMPARAPRVPKPKRTPQSQVLDSFEYSPMSASPKAPRPATNRDDTDYNALPDYCPPLDTIPKGNNKILKAEWKGTVLDLSNDPDRHLLHEAELYLASTLRLNCATYLCSKRRIFQSRIEALQIGKEFRKTDAQQACKIDVNKASKLWTSYEKVGWFKPEYFRQYL